MTTGESRYARGAASAKHGVKLVAAVAMLVAVALAAGCGEPAPEKVTIDEAEESVASATSNSAPAPGADTVEPDGTQTPPDDERASDGGRAAEVESASDGGRAAEVESASDGGRAAEVESVSDGGRAAEVESASDGGRAAEVESARSAIKAAIDSYIAPGPPQELTNAELGCLSNSILGSLSDERLIELAPSLTADELYDGLPQRLLSDDEADRIVQAATGCLDWPAIVARTVSYQGVEMPVDVPACVTEALESDRFAEQTVRTLLFDSAEAGLGNVLGLYGSDCLEEVLSEQTLQLVAMGISEQSADCYTRRTIDALTQAVDVSETTDEEQFGQIMAGMMMALGCLSEQEFEILMDAGLAAQP